MTKRPERDVVEAAIEGSKGNLTRAAVTLRCSRTALYEWIWQLGLQHKAGLDTHARQDGSAPSRHDAGGGIVSVKLGGGVGPRLLGNMSAEAIAQHEVRMPHSIRVRDGLWTKVAHAALDLKVSMSDVVEEALAKWLEEREK